MDFRTKFPDRAEKADVTSEKREQSKDPSIAKTSELGQKSLQAPPPESPAALMRNIYQAAMEEADATLQCGEEQREAIVKEAIAAWIDAAQDPVIATKLFEQDLESHGHFVERGGIPNHPDPRSESSPAGSYLIKNGFKDSEYELHYKQRAGELSKVYTITVSPKGYQLLDEKGQPLSDFFVEKEGCLTHLQDKLK